MPPLNEDCSIKNDNLIDIKWKDKFFFFFFFPLLYSGGDFNLASLHEIDQNSVTNKGKSNIQNAVSGKSLNSL